MEDSEDTLALLETIFAQEGASVTTASSATEALDVVATRKPGLIISDLGMPEMDGYEFLKRVRRLPGMSEIPAIAVSGYASEEDRKRALAVGYTALVAKPIDVDALFTLIQELRLPGVSP